MYGNDVPLNDFCNQDNYYGTDPWESDMGTGNAGKL